jgi:hypothetical protein
MKIIIFGTKEFLRRVLKGNKSRPYCSHLWMPFHPWTNTAVSLANVRVICHNCYL